jgi:para-nitrobenzyl esterase
MILGNTRDETRGFVDARGPKLQGLDWSNLAERMTPELRMDTHPEWVVEQYRARFPEWSPERVFYAATTAGRSWPGQVLEADARAAAKTPTWVYQLDFQSPVEPWRGAPHTLDIPLVFGTLDAEGSIAGTGEASRKVSREMMDAFIAFARTGDPSRPALPWPVHTLPARETMVFDTSSRAVNDPRQWERELFARVPYIQPGT